jgi:hypothetical protein
MDTPHNSPEHESLTSKHDYLWDKSGEPDPEILKLEAALTEFRHASPVPVLPEIAPERPRIFFAWRQRLIPLLSASAAAIAAIATFFYFAHTRKPPSITEAGWDVSRVAGSPRIGEKIITGQVAATRLAVGQVLETDDHSRASLQAEGVGQIEIDASTSLRLLAMGTGLKRIALDHGTIHAFIWAPPGQFVVDTPSALAVDLGCSYTLQVDASGAGLVRTALGWVGFELHGRESFIPAGAACATKPHVGPGTPYFEDATPEFRSALAKFDFVDATPEQRVEDLTIILAAARKRDALTVWHLLSRVDEPQRLMVYDRLRTIAPPPAGVTKEGILRLEPPMLDQWWNALGFDNISVWRQWERSWARDHAPSLPK